MWNSAFNDKLTIKIKQNENILFPLVVEDEAGTETQFFALYKYNSRHLLLLFGEKAKFDCYTYLFHKRIF